MKKLFLILSALMLTGCGDPKYHYNDCVKIKDTFYGPTYGIVIEYWGDMGYTVLRRIGKKVSEWHLPERYLTKVDNKFCSNIENNK